MSKPIKVTLTTEDLTAMLVIAAEFDLKQIKHPVFHSAVAKASQIMAWTESEATNSVRFLASTQGIEVVIS